MVSYSTYKNLLAVELKEFRKSNQVLDMIGLTVFLFPGLVKAIGFVYGVGFHRKGEGCNHICPYGNPALDLC